MKYNQVTALRSWLLDGLGWCLRYSQSLFNAPVAFESAREAWDGQKGRHAGEWPPEGVQSVIWFDHWGTYGKPARYANWGHVAVALGDGRVLTSPLRNSQLKQWDAGKGEMVGSAIYPSMLAMMRDLGGNPRYLGWSEFINGLQVVKPAPGAPATIKPNPGQEEDEDMARNVCVATPVGKSNKVRIFTLETGDVHEYTSPDKSYIDNVAKTYGCAMVSYITASHYERIGVELAATRAAREKRATA